MEAFHDAIEELSPDLGAILPANTTGSRQELHEYLSGWLGGSELYLAKRGQPRLRVRHFPTLHGDCPGPRGVDGPMRVFLEGSLGPLAEHMINPLTGGPT